MKLKKKGFTIVELVIVIAVIAILAAVLIPTFANLINRANRSADEQAVTNINTILKSEEAMNGKPEDVYAVKKILRENGYASLNAYSGDWALGWYQKENVVVLHSADAVLYPAQYTSVSIADITPFAEILVNTADAFRNQMNQLTSGMTVKLTADIALNQNTTIGISEGETAEIDLNGHTLTANTASVFDLTSTGKLVLRNGNVINKKEGNGSTIVPSIIFPTDEGSNVYVEDCYMESTGAWSYVFVVNGSQSSNVTATFVNCTIKAPNSVGAYIPASGNYTFRHCTIIGKTGLVICGGNVTVDGCTVQGRGIGDGAAETVRIYSPDHYEDGGAGVDRQITTYLSTPKNGCVYFGSAIDILDKRNGYSLNSVTIKNSTIVSHKHTKGSGTVEDFTLYGLLYNSQFSENWTGTTQAVINIDFDSLIYKICENRDESTIRAMTSEESQKYGYHQFSRTTD